MTFFTWSTREDLQKNFILRGQHTQYIHTDIATTRLTLPGVKSAKIQKNPKHKKKTKATSEGGKTYCQIKDLLYFGETKLFHVWYGAIRMVLNLIKITVKHITILPMTYNTTIPN